MGGKTAYTDQEYRILAEGVQTVWIMDCFIRIWRDSDGIGRPDNEI